MSLFRVKLGTIGHGVKARTGYSTLAVASSKLLCASEERLWSDPELAGIDLKECKKMNMFQAINDAMRSTMEKDSSTILIGEDVGFGGVFRCSMGLQKQFGRERVFNTPLSEQGIAGFAAGYAAMGSKVIAEIQFADYIFPAFDQIVNEIAKYRYRSGNMFNVGGLTIRSPCGAVGHGGLYHSQSPEAYFAHTPGLKIVIPRSPVQAKGLLIASVKDQNPVLFFEPKILYRSSVELVPTTEYALPIGKAQVLTNGTDVTVVGWGSQIYILEKAVERARDEGISCELIDLRTILPWDVDGVVASVQKTGRLVIVHEAPLTGGFGAEIAASIQEKCIFALKSPIIRVCGWDTPFPCVFEPFYVPNMIRCLEGIKRTMSY